MCANPPKTGVAAAGLHRAARFRVLAQRRRLAVAADRRLVARLVAVLALVVLLEARHDAQVRLALRTVVLGFAPQNAPMPVDRVPAEVAAERRSGPDHRTVLRPVLQGQLANGLRWQGQRLGTCRTG